MMIAVKVPVTERALFSRCNRALAKDGESLRRCRADSPAANELGRYYTIDLHAGRVEAKHIELDELARELGVLADHEELAE